MIWFLDLIAWIPIFGGFLNSLGYVLLVDPFRINWSSTYSNGAIGDISMARNNANCAANVYFETREILKVDKSFASDADFFLNGIQASQLFYIALDNLHVGWLGAVPIVDLLIGTPINLVKWLAGLGLPIITLMLQADTEELKPIANVAQQLKDELDANGGKLIDAGGQTS